MKVSATVFTLFSVDITWLHLLIGCGVLLALYVVFGLILEKKPRISLTEALRDTANAAVDRPGDVIRLLLTEFCLLLICLTPLLLLTELPLRYPAGLTVLWWFLLRNPARANTAEAMQDSLAGRRLFSLRLADSSRWGGKLWRGLVRAGFLACWAVPLAAGLFHAYRIYKGTDEMDGLTVLRSIQEYGHGDVMTGAVYLLLILLGLVLILLIGIAYHSGARHASALGNPRLVYGHHGKIVLGWFLSTFIFMLPLWIALGIVLSQVLPMLDVNDVNGIIAGSVKLPRKQFMTVVMAVGCLLTVPMIPVRSLMIAAMVRQLKDQEEYARP